MLVESFVDHRIFLEQNSKTEPRHSSSKLKKVNGFYSCGVI